MLIKTTLTQRSLSVANLTYSIENNILTIILNTAIAHNLQGSIPITIAGAVALDTEFDDILLNGLKIFDVINSTQLRTNIFKISDIIFPSKLATGTITANINQLILPVDIKNREDNILIYTLQDGYVLGGATINYTLKLWGDNIGTTTPLFSIPSGTLSSLKQNMLIEFKVINSIITTNIPIVIQV